MEERDLRRSCVELGSQLTLTKRPFTLFLSMKGFRFELVSSSYPQRAPRMAEKPRDISWSTAVELQSSKKAKKKSPCRMRRDAVRRGIFQKRKDLDSQQPSSLPSSLEPSPGTGLSPVPADGTKQPLAVNQPITDHTSYGCVHNGCGYKSESARGLAIHVGRAHKIEALRGQSTSSGNDPGEDRLERELELENREEVETITIEEEKNDRLETTVRGSVEDRVEERDWRDRELFFLLFQAVWETQAMVSINPRDQKHFMRTVSSC